MRVSLQLPQEILSGRVLAPRRLERSLRSKPFHRQSPSPRGGDGECTQVRLEGPSNLTSRILNIGRSLKTSKLSIFATQKPEVEDASSRLAVSCHGPVAPLPVPPSNSQLLLQNRYQVLTDPHTHSHCQHAYCPVAITKQAAQNRDSAEHCPPSSKGP